MTLKCSDPSKPCPFRTAELCFNPCVLKAAEDGIKFGEAMSHAKSVDVTELHL